MCVWLDALEKRCGAQKYEKEKELCLKLGFQKGLKTMFIAALLTIAKMWKQPKKCSSADKWIKK